MILVTGATGSTGGHLVSQLKARGSAFKALVRDRGKGDALGAPYAVGDFADPASLAAAMAGVDRVFLASPGAQGYLVDGEQPMIRWERNVIDAAKAAGVRHVVKLSVWNARIGGPMSEGGHGAVEAYLKESGLEWTMLQPGGYMQNFLRPETSLGDEDGNLIGPEGDARVAFVDCFDIAAVAAELLTGDTGRNNSYVITGPEAVTYTEIAAKLSEGRGRPVGFRGEPARVIADRLRGYGLDSQLADDLAGQYASLGAGVYEEVTDVVERFTGRKPRDFDAFMAANPQAYPALASSAR
ncbi:SDR family oxidoreductase [Glycomyces sp. NPDC048151]|uniref:SDR family oxidoreductase n=1 Tax=Glycomyces sp. NPDC048151 TaxID=3364002 RepID=UPI00370FD743